MATLVVLKPGVTTTNSGTGTAAAAAGDVCPNDEKTVLRFTNTNAAGVTVTIAKQKPNPDGYTNYVDMTVVVPATTGDVLKGPFPKSIYDNTTGQLVLTYTFVTNLLVWPISAGG